MEPNVTLSRDGDLFPNPTSYRWMIGRLISVFDNHIAKYFIFYSIIQPIYDSPRKPHMDVAYKVLRYIKSSLRRCIFFLASSSKGVL